jgi:hypothetical protein
VLPRPALAALVGALVIAAPAAAAPPPPNDKRANATPLGQPPVTVSGNTTGSTKDATDPNPFCGAFDGSLWYRLSGAEPGRLVLRFTAQGDLDAFVAVYKMVRSQLALQRCAGTDAKGRAAVSFTVERDAVYLIEVARIQGSEDGPFQFRLFAPEPSSRPPGAPLPRRGVTSTVDPLVDFDDAWSLAMKPGTTYKVNLAPARGKCVVLSLFRPRTRSFSDSRPIHSLSCGGYLTLTPGPGGGGRYSILVTASGTKAGAEGYHLAASEVGPDDTAPGTPLANLQTRRGSLNARGLDVVDLFRFDVATRSDVTLGLRETGSASFDLVLIGETGKRLGCECGHSGSRRLTLQLPPGHYFAAVRAREFSHGSYALSLLVRQITSVAITFGSGHASPHQAVAATAHVALATAGRIVFRIERFDPLMSWQFAKRYQLHVDSAGTASATFVPPTIGRWRVRAFYSGTRMSSPSKSGFATLVVR